MPNRSNTSRSYQFAAAPDGGHRIDLRIRPAHAALQPQPLVTLDRVQMVDHFEARLGRIPVDGRDRAQAHELLVSFRKPAQIDDRCRVGDPACVSPERLRLRLRESRAVASESGTLTCAASFGAWVGRRTSPARPSSRCRKTRPGSARRRPASRRSRTSSSRGRPPPRDTETWLRYRTG